MGNNKHNTGRIGKRGEDAAAVYLAERGHTILERNWRYGHLEIDIITLDSDGLHFVEVKSRFAPAGNGPEEGVTALKQRRVAKAAAAYISRRGICGQECRFDIVAITFEDCGINIRYFPDAFIPVFM